MYPQRQTTPSTLSSSRSIRSASHTRCSTFVTPRAWPTRRATSTISGEKSVEITLPSSPSGDHEAEVTGPGRHIEDRLARLRVDLVQDPPFTGLVFLISHSRRASQPDDTSSQVARLSSR